MFATQCAYQYKTNDYLHLSSLQEMTRSFDILWDDIGRGGVRVGVVWKDCGCVLQGDCFTQHRTAFPPNQWEVQRELGGGEGKETRH